MKLDYARMLKDHVDAGAKLTIAACEVPDVGRFGALEVTNGTLTGFTEKGGHRSVIINAGTYLLSRDVFPRYDLGNAFSFEQDFLATYYESTKPPVFATKSNFIDIGVAEDYHRAESIISARDVP